MKRDVSERCGRCGKVLAPYDTIQTTGNGTELLCSRCFNRNIAARMGLDEPPDFETMTLIDGRGAAHEFHFQTLFVPTGLAIYAFEVLNETRGGYEFAVLGGFDADPLKLFERLLGKMRRAVARTHIERGEFGRQISDENMVRGRIAWDDEHDGRIPLVIVDGQELKWEELGRMLMTYEGFHFKLEIKDRTEEV